MIASDLETTKNLIEKISSNKTKSRLFLMLNFNKIFNSITYDVYHNNPTDPVRTLEMLESYMSAYSLSTINISFMKQSFEYAKVMTKVDAITALTFNVGLIDLSTVSHKIGLLLGVLFHNYEFNETLAFLLSFR